MARKPRSAPVPAPPSQSEPKRDRDELGRLLPGHGVKSPGRPRGVDLRSLAAQQEANGFDLAGGLWKVLTTLLEQAQKGDVASAKLLLDRLAEPDRHEVDITTTALTDAERAARLQAILTTAARRTATDE